ncbi:MAG: hypothetical protein WCD69_07360, partial [Xanthobacteraceae bacterium]
MPAMHAKRRDEHTAQELIHALRRLHMTPADLKALIELTHDFISEDLERRLDALKASRDGAGLPREVLRSEITRNHVCMCRSALHYCE